MLKFNIMRILSITNNGAKKKQMEGSDMLRGIPKIRMRILSMEMLGLMGSMYICHFKK